MLPFIIFSIFFFLLLMIIITCQDDKITTLTAQNGMMRDRLNARLSDEALAGGSSKTINEQLTVVGIEEAVRNAGFSPDTSDGWVRFVAAGEQFFISTSRLPQIFISRYYNVQTSDWDMQLLKKAAHLMSDELIMVKAVFDEQPNGTTLRFFVAAMDRNSRSFRENIRAYLEIILDGARRLNEIYADLEKEKESSKEVNHLAPVSQQEPKLLS